MDWSHCLAVVPISAKDARGALFRGLVGSLGRRLERRERVADDARDRHLGDPHPPGDPALGEVVFEAPAQVID